MANNKAKEIYMTGYVRWAKLFPSNMDKYEKHFDQTGGRFMVDFYPESEKELSKFWDTDVGSESMGSPRLRDQSHRSYGDGDVDLGIGSWLRLKRDNISKTGIDAFGGSPYVFDFRDGPSTKQWDSEADGVNIWNGSKVQVKLNIWGTGGTANIRLDAVAVMELAAAPEMDDTEDKEPTF